MLSLTYSWTHSFKLYSLVLLTTISFLFLATPSLEGSLLSMSTALSRAYESDSTSAVSASQISALRANRMQVGMLKNPEFSVFLEDFDGSLIYGGWDNSQITFTIAQEIDVWKKRAAQVELARYEEIIAEQDAMIVRQIVRKELVERFFAAFALQEKMRLAKEKWQHAEESFKRFQIHVREGRQPASLLPSEELRIMRLSLEYEAAERLVTHAYHLLALRMGAQGCDFHALDYGFYDLLAPSQNVLDCAALQGHPLLARARASIDASRQRIVVEKRALMPNPQLVLGVRQLPGLPCKKRAFAFVAGLTFPLTIWDCNQGSINAAQAQLEGDEARLQVAEKQLQAELAERHQELVHAYITAKNYREKILTKGQQHYLASVSAFQEGLLPLAEWNQTEQDWFAMQEDFTQALLQYHQRKEALDSLLTLLSLETSLP